MSSKHWSVLAVEHLQRASNETTIHKVRRNLSNIYIKTEKTFKNEHRSKDAAAKKRPNTSVVGKINNYYEDIYIPPNNNTD